MRGVTVLLLLSAAAFVEGDQLSVEELVQLRQSAVQEHYTFSPKRVTSIEVDEPPLVDGRLDDGCWASAMPVSDFALVGSEGPPTQGTEVRVCHRGGVLYVGFRCREASMEARPKPDIPDYTPVDWENQADTVQLCFSVANDHTYHYRLLIEPTGHTKLFAGYRLRGEFPTDSMVAEYELPRGTSFACEVVDEAHAWTGEVAVPVSALACEGDLTGRVWGFNVVRVRRPTPEETSAWCPSPGTPVVHPIDYGELVFGRRDVDVAAIDLGRPCWGENSAGLTVVNRGPAERRLRVLARVYLPVDEVLYDQYEGVVVVAIDETRELSVPYRLSPRGKWPVYGTYCQRLSLRLEDADTGEPVYATSYPMAFDVGVKPNERYGQTRDAPNPEPDDPRFIAKKRDFIIGRIPEFTRLGKADGAESEFVLAAVDGSARFDLMAEDVIQRMADWLYGLFDTDVDRMLGATFFVHQRTVTCHSGFLSATGPMNPLSTLRRGGGLCDSRAKVLAGILSRMTREETGEVYHCQCLGLKGHVVCAVAGTPDPESAADYWVLDPDVGMFYFARDNTRFTRLGELRRDRWLSYRMNFNNVRHSHEFYFNTDHQFTYEWEHTPVWPPDAPAW